MTTIKLRRNNTAIQWGFRLNGGVDLPLPLHIQKVFLHFVLNNKGLTSELRLFSKSAHLRLGFKIGRPSCWVHYSGLHNGQTLQMHSKHCYCFMLLSAICMLLVADFLFIK